MMFVNDVNGKDYGVKFYHTMNPKDGERAGTLCKIVAVPTGEQITKDSPVVAFGKAELAPQDQFNKKIGRKLSMARALASAGLDRQTRTLFWDKYLWEFNF